MHLVAFAKSQGIRGDTRMMTHRTYYRIPTMSRSFTAILGVNRVNLTITPGITSLVVQTCGKVHVDEPQTGLLKPTRGAISILGTSPDRPDELFRRWLLRRFDSFPPGVTGTRIYLDVSVVHGLSRAGSKNYFQSVGTGRTGGGRNRKVAAYSKGMRQRVRLAAINCA